MNLLRMPVHPDELESRCVFASGEIQDDSSCGQPGSIWRFSPGSATSVWCMYLPATSYYGPLAAFWWVSNERPSNQ